MKINKKNVFVSRNVQQVLTKDQLYGIKIISGPSIEGDKKFRVYGSYAYGSQAYPSDIDGTQTYEFCVNKKKGCSIGEVQKITVKILQETVKKIIETPNVYLGDIKIGVDTEITNAIIEIQSKAYKDTIDVQWYEYLEKKNMKDPGIGLNEEDKLTEDQVPQLLINKYTINYPSYEALLIWKKLHDEGIISKESYAEINKLIPGKLKGKEGMEIFFNYCEFIRQLMTLRWTGKEVIQGFKMIGDRKITILEAVESCIEKICDGIEKEKKNGRIICVNEKGIQVGFSELSHIIKIDMFAIANNKIWEYSNLFTLVYKDENKKKKLLSSCVKSNQDILKDDLKNASYAIRTNQKDSLKYPTEDLLILSHGRRIGGVGDEATRIFINSLLTDMLQYYFEVTSKFKKAMKYAKRMYVVALLKDNKDIGLKLANLFNSDINLLNNINSQVDLVQAVLSEHRDKAPIEILYNQLEEQKFRLSTILSMDLCHDAFYEIINKIVKGDMKLDEVIATLKEIKKCFSEIVDKHVKKYLKDQDLWPGPYFNPSQLEFVYG